MSLARRFFKKKHGHPRSQFVVSRPEQFMYGASFLIFFFSAIAGVSIPLLYVWLSGTGSECFSGGENAIPLHYALALLAACLLPGGLLSFLLGVLISHRTFGPTVPLKEFLRKLLEGDYSARVRFRQKDHFQELLPLLNQLAEKLEKEKRG